MGHTLQKLGAFFTEKPAPGPYRYRRKADRQRERRDDHKQSCGPAIHDIHAKSDPSMVPVPARFREGLETINYVSLVSAGITQGPPAAFSLGWPLKGPLGQKDRSRLQASQEKKVRPVKESSFHTVKLPIGWIWPNWARPPNKTCPRGPANYRLLGGPLGWPLSPSPRRPVY